MRLNHPKPNTQFTTKNNRLALIHHIEEPRQYWTDYWSGEFKQTLIENAKSGDSGEFTAVFSRYIPVDLPVLEAGCGSGHHVMALQAQRFEVIGVDNEPEVVKYVNRNFPSINVRYGDVLALDFPDEFFGCYISLGVVEHFEEGPDLALKEARRVVHPTGVALISVPYLNPFRQSFLNLNHPIGEIPEGMKFHQYYFSIEEFKLHLNKHHFKIIDRFPYAVQAFLIREHPVFSRFWNSIFCRERLKIPMRRIFRASNIWMRNRYAHMMMYVCKPV